MLTEQSKNRIGQIIFETIAIAMREVSSQMEAITQKRFSNFMRFSTWGDVDTETKRNYMRVVDSIEREIEQETPVAKELPIMDEPQVETTVQSEPKPASIQNSIAPERQPEMVPFDTNESKLVKNMVVGMPGVRLARQPKRNPFQCECGKLAKSKSGLQTHKKHCKVTQLVNA